MPKPETSKHYRAIALELCKILYDAIDEAGSEGIPSGHLYAMLTGNISLDLYQKLIGTLKEHGLIEEKGYLLKTAKAKGGE